MMPSETPQTRLESQLSRRRRRMFATGLRSGPAGRQEHGMTMRLISAGWAFVASVLTQVIARAAAFPFLGQTAPKREAEMVL